MDYDQLYDKLYRYCYFKLRHRELAEDITQEAFLRLLEHGQSSTAYLYTIARNLCIDAYRSPKMAQLEEQMPSGGEEEMLSSLSVKIALSRLEEDERELVLLRYVNELKIQQIAQMLGISRFALRRRLQQAMKKLKENLKEEDFL